MTGVKCSTLTCKGSRQATRSSPRGAKKYWREALEVEGKYDDHGGNDENGL